MIERIVSGAQTGADQGGLYAAQILDIPTGGYAPRGWLTEQGPMRELMQSFGLVECKVGGYAVRTAMNVAESDGTVVFGKINSPGSKLTIGACVTSKKPCLVLEWPWVMMARKAYMVEWLLKNKIKVLNCAGNRESVNPGICQAVCEFMVEVLGG